MKKYLMGRKIADLELFMCLRFVTDIIQVHCYTVTFIDLCSILCIHIADECTKRQLNYFELYRNFVNFFRKGYV